MEINELEALAKSGVEVKEEFHQWMLTQIEKGVTPTAFFSGVVGGLLQVSEMHPYATHLIYTVLQQSLDILKERP